jgi:hypothetical protein
MDEAPPERGMGDPPEAQSPAGRNARETPTSTAIPGILFTVILH